MSSINIRVNTDVLDNQSYLVKSDVQSIDRHWKSIGKLINGSRGYWEGEASDAHVKIFREIEADVEKVIQRLATNSDKLRMDAGVYRDVENTNIAAAGNLPTDIFG